MSAPFKTFLCEYGYNGHRWCFDIQAESWDDARDRLKAIGMGQVIGTDAIKIPVPFGGLIYRIWRWLQKAN